METPTNEALSGQMMMADVAVDADGTAESSARLSTTEGRSGFLLFLFFVLLSWERIRRILRAHGSAVCCSRSRVARQMHKTVWNRVEKKKVLAFLLSSPG